MGSGMGAHLQELDSPAVALRQILNSAALKEASHLLRSVLVVAILNLGNLDRGSLGSPSSMGIDRSMIFIVVTLLLIRPVAVACVS